MNEEQKYDAYYDLPVRGPLGVISGVQEVEEEEGLVVDHAIMYIDPESHYLNCVGRYDVTQLVASHDILGLARFAKSHTARYYPRATVDIIVYWKEV